MKFLFDIDGILCENGSHENYKLAIPIQENIDEVNKLIDENHEVILYTSRKTQDKEITENWLRENSVKYSSIIFDKPTADYYIDDKASDFVPKSKAKLNRKKLCICVSGGMDSYIAYHYALKNGYKKEDIVCVNFDIGHPYKEKEKIALDSFGFKYKTIRVDLINQENGNIPSIQNYVIPGRNMIFASIASSFGERVWIMGMKFENHYLMFDKNEEFFRLATIALSQALGERTIIESPFMNMSKTEAIKWALDNGITKEELGLSTSCYHATKKRCGECSLCFKRNVAMLANGIQEDYEINPFESNEGKKLITKYLEALKNEDYSHYQKERIIETLNIYNNL